MIHWPLLPARGDGRNPGSHKKVKLVTRTWLLESVIQMRIVEHDTRHITLLLPASAAYAAFDPTGRKREEPGTGSGWVEGS